MSHRVILIPAYVLHTRPYKDTSLLVDLFTESRGRIAVVARGAKRAKSQTCGLLLPFVPVLVSFSGKTELFNLNNVDANGSPHFLKKDKLLSGFYLNELLFKLLHSSDPHPELYQAYRCTLQKLDSSVNKYEHELALRIFEKRLLQEIGFGLQLNRTSEGLLVDDESLYSFRYGFGFSKLTHQEMEALQEGSRTDNVFSGKSLLALHDDRLQSPEEFKESKKLLRMALEAVLNNRPIKSRELFI